MCVTLLAPCFHHSVNDFRGVSRMSTGLVLIKRDSDRVVLSQMAVLHLLLIEHNLLSDVRWPLIPVGIITIKLDG